MTRNEELMQLDQELDGTSQTIARYMGRAEYHIRSMVREPEQVSEHLDQTLDAIRVSMRLLTEATEDAAATIGIEESVWIGLALDSIARPLNMITNELAALHEETRIT